MTQLSFLLLHWSSRVECKYFACIVMVFQKYRDRAGRVNQLSDLSPIRRGGCTQKATLLFLIAAQQKWGYRFPLRAKQFPAPIVAVQRKSRSPACYAFFREKPRPKLPLTVPIAPSPLGA
jgi:hypothetical protein